MDGRSRHGKHVSFACKACRTRKAKCSGNGQGRCSSCIAHGDICEWDKDDGRRTIKKEEAKYLRLMNKNLLTELGNLTNKLRLYEQNPAPQPSLSIDIPEYHTVVQSPTSAAVSAMSFGAGSDLFMHGLSPTSTLPSSVGSMSTENPFIGDNFVRLFASRGKLNLSTVTGDRVTALPGSSPCAYEFALVTSVTLPISEPKPKTEDFDDHVVWTVAMPAPDAAYSSIITTYLPASITSIFTINAHNALLRGYFESRIAWSFPECLFWRDMSIYLEHFQNGTGHELLFFSQSLHVAVLLEAFIQSNSLFNDGDDLAAHARALAERECLVTETVVPGIHALLILAKYYVAKGGFESIGLGILATAYHAACRHGLNLDASLTDDAERRWAYASCYMALFLQDIELALHIGADPTVAPPTSELLKINPPAGFISPSEWKSFTLAVQLAAIVRDITLIDGTHGRPAYKALECSELLSVWSEKLPNVVQLVTSTDSPIQFLILDMMHQWAIISLHRLLYTYGDNETNYKMVEDAEKRFFRTLKQFKERRGHFLPSSVPFGLVQITFLAGVAALVRLSTLSAGAQRAQRTIRENAERACETLHQMAGAWPCAHSLGNILADRLAPQSSPIIPLSHATSVNQSYQATAWTNVLAHPIPADMVEWDQPAPSLLQHEIYDGSLGFLGFDASQEMCMNEQLF